MYALISCFMVMICYLITAIFGSSCICLAFNAIRLIFWQIKGCMFDNYSFVEEMTENISLGIFLLYSAQFRLFIFLVYHFCQHFLTLKNETNLIGQKTFFRHKFSNAFIFLQFSGIKIAEKNSSLSFRF